MKERKKLKIGGKKPMTPVTRDPI